MSVTVKMLEDSVREILLDIKPAHYRWSPDVIFRGIRDGIKRLHSIRPESRYFGMMLVANSFPAVDGDLDEETITSVRETQVLIDERWVEAVVYYAVHKAYLFDNPDTANDTLSNRYIELFKGISAT